MKALGITTSFQFTQRQCPFWHQGQKWWQNSLRLFCRIGHYFALVGKIDTISVKCECRCIICPNVENFCPNNGQFFSIGDATAFPASPCRTLMQVRTVPAVAEQLRVLSQKVRLRIIWEETYCSVTGQIFVSWHFATLQRTWVTQLVKCRNCGRSGPQPVDIFGGEMIATCCFA